MNVFAFLVIYSITPDSGPSQITVIVDTSNTNATNRSWILKIWQYNCQSPNLAPTGCLQYYTGASGQFQSFNYKTTVNGDGPNHLAYLNYAICFRDEHGFCGIKFSQAAGDIYSFTVSGDASVLTNMADVTRVMYDDQKCSLEIGRAHV